MQLENLIFRRQFLITSQKLTIDPNWKTIHTSKFSIDHYIYSHPDLEVNVASNETTEIILLGYVIDPYNPEDNNQDIINKLVNSLSFDEVIAKTDAFGGRFVILYNTADKLNLFHDPTGFREVYYLESQDGFACGSTPNIISKYLCVPKDDEPEINRFFNSTEFNSFDKVWIGNRTIMKGIFKLLPNHCIDFTTKKVSRFWPCEEKKHKNLTEVATLLGEIVSGTYKAAVKRFNLEHSLTSGWDTRLLLACSKDHVHNIKYYFYRGFRDDKKEKDGPDYLLTRKISEGLNLSARFAFIGDHTVTPEFEQIFYENNLHSRAKLLNAYYDTFINKLENTVTVSGTMGNEIYRLVTSLNRKASDAHTIASIIGYEKFPYIINSINDWLESAQDIKKKGHILIDHFFWEQYFGNWGSLSSAEQDIVREELRPLNNRKLIAAFISLDDKNRYRDYPLGYKKTIEMLWPELLKYDMDMPSKRLKKTLRILGLERFVDKVYHTIKK